MKPHILLAMLTAALAGCERDMSNDEYLERSNAAIDFSVTATPDDDGSTRGIPITDVSQMTDIGVCCFYTGNLDWSSSAKPGKMFNTRLVRNATTGAWDYAGTPIEWNPSTGNDRYSFCAYAPYASAQNGISVVGSAAMAGIPVLNYSVPTNTLNQPDLMLAVPRYNMRPSTSTVALQMNHALTCVGFQIKGNGEKIKSISLNNIYAYGTTPMDGGSVNWALTGGVSNFAPVINYDAGKSYYTTTPTMSANLLPGNGYLMMIPQTLASNATVRITFDDNSTKDILLNSQQWIAGQRITYNIIITPQAVIVLTPNILTIQALGGFLSKDSFSLSCTPTTASWSLTSNASWLRLTTNALGLNPQPTISGTGNATIYVVADPNTTGTQRTAQLKVGSTVVGTITQLRYIAPGALPNGGSRPVNETSYVGAYWRASQRGERIIRIPVGSTTTAYGTWNASVIWTDGQWSAKDILLSTTPSLDLNISFISVSATPGDAELFNVTDAQSVVSGSVAANGNIYFRISLANTYAPTPYLPARYALIALNYNNLTKTQLIFLRQGENDDYLMRPTDASTGSFTSSTRPLARKIQAYNITANTWLTWLGGPLIATHPTQAIQGGVLTQYPTQAGGMFQWGCPDQPRRAFHPVTPETLSIIGWSDNIAAGYWNTLAATHEVCPPGYKRMNDGSESAVTTQLASQSEIRQSLFTTPGDGGYNAANNFIVGFYADGFFDRRAKVQATAGSLGLAASYLSGITDILNATVAYGGTVFFNPNNWASVFFPSAGARPGQTMTPGVPINQAGFMGLYLTSSLKQAGYSFSGMQTGLAGNMVIIGNQFNANVAASIRCVRVP